MSAQLGFLAYRVYCARFKGRHANGVPRKHWDDLSAETRQAWVDVAVAIRATAAGMTPTLPTKPGPIV